MSPLQDRWKKILNRWNVEHFSMHLIFLYYTQPRGTDCLVTFRGLLYSKLINTITLPLYCFSLKYHLVIHGLHICAHFYRPHLRWYFFRITFLYFCKCLLLTTSFPINRAIPLNFSGFASLFNKTLFRLNEVQRICPPPTVYFIYKDNLVKGQTSVGKKRRSEVPILQN